MKFHMAHMPMGAMMWAAMAAIVVGMVMAGWGLAPRRGHPPRHRAVAAPVTPALPVSGPNRARVRRRLVVVLSFALLVDQMKPASLAFILPGVRAEYGIGASEAALLPMSALTGTVIGSVLWGHLADRIGRRSAVLLAALLFLSTTVCGAMPSYEGNVLMCVLMGMSAGGMLPIVYTLMAEVLPGRSGVLVLQAGLTTVGGYLAASGLAAVFVPLAGWRVLWFLQLPLALALIGVNRWIPESPSFLLSRGRTAEAHRMADLFGLPRAAGTAPPGTGKTTDTSGTGRLSGVAALFGSSHLSQTLIITGYGLSWGIIYWGFMTFLPGILEQAGLGTSSSQVLFLAALLALPGTAAGAWLFSRWSSRKTMALYGVVTAAALGALAFVPLRDNPVGVGIAMVGLLTGASGVVAVLGPYAAQIYPTAFRGLGSGLSAACGKSGGMVGPPLIAWLLATLPLGAVASVVALPMALAAGAVALRGRETTRGVGGGAGELPAAGSQEVRVPSP